MGLRTVTSDLLARFLPGSADPPPGPHDLVVTYVRVVDAAGTDPRTGVLRPSARWRLTPGTTLGAGRAPRHLDAAAPVDVSVPLVEDEGRTDRTVPRLAVHLAFDRGVWWVSNHARSGATVLVTAPGSSEELGARGPVHAVGRRRLTLTVRARCERDGGPAAVEHRLTLLAPWIPDDAPLAPELETVPDGDPDGGRGDGPDGGPDPRDGLPTDDTTTSDLTHGLRWTWAQQRLLAAWAYPELLGLPPLSQPRERTTRLLLRQGTDGRDPNERILSRLRRRASHELGVPLTGEPNTPAFLAYVVGRRGYLGDALAALHAEYDATNRPDVANRYDATSRPDVANRYDA